MKHTIIIVITAIVLFEIMEHVVFPVIWFIKDRKKRSVCGVTGMLGKVGEIKCWREFEGQVFVHGELWGAVSEFPLSAGDRVVVQNVHRLTLNVIPFKESGAD